MVRYGKALLVALSLGACSRSDYTIDWYSTELPDSVYADVDLDTRHIRISSTLPGRGEWEKKPLLILRDHERCHLVMNDAGIIWPDSDSLGNSKTEEKVCDAMARFMNR